VRLSACNLLKGKVIQIKPGSINTEVILELPGGAQIVSIITKESADNLGLAVGKWLMPLSSIRRHDCGGLILEFE